MSNIAYAIGMTAGVIGIMIAVYLEWIIDRGCRAKYVYAYLILGVALVLISAQDVFQTDLLYIKSVGFGIILLLEIYGFVYLYGQIQNPKPSSEYRYRAE